MLKKILKLGLSAWLIILTIGLLNISQYDSLLGRFTKHLFGTISYPTTLDSFTNPTATNTVTSPSHSQQHANANDAITALETKLGIGASTPISNSLLNGTSAGVSSWSATPTISGLIAIASTTLQRLTFTSGTSTSATSTNFFSTFLTSTTASTTSLFGAGLTACSGSNALQWSAGSFGCVSVASAGPTSVFSSLVANAATTTVSLSSCAAYNSADIDWQGAVIGSASTTADIRLTLNTDVSAAYINNAGSRANFIVISSNPGDTRPTLRGGTIKLTSLVQQTLIQYSSTAVATSSAGYLDPTNDSPHYAAYGTTSPTFVFTSLSLSTSNGSALATSTRINVLCK